MKALNVLTFLCLFLMALGCDGTRRTPTHQNPDGDIDPSMDGDTNIDGDGEDIDEPNPWIWVDLEMSFENGTVIDPKLEGEPEISIAITSDEPALSEQCTVFVEAYGISGRTRVLVDDESWTDEGFTLSFNGRDDAGVAFDTGPVQIVADIYCHERLQGFGQAIAYVVRLGVVAVNFEGDPVEIAYHKLDLFHREITFIDDTLFEYLNDRESEQEMSGLDLDTGEPRPQLAPWSSADYPPWGHGEPGQVGLGSHNIPAAYLAGDSIELTALIGGTTVSESYGIAMSAQGPEEYRQDLPEIRVVLPGFDPIDENSLWQPEGELRFVSSNPLPTTVGSTDMELAWSFQVRSGEQWLDIPGTQTTVHRIYRLPGRSYVPDGTKYGASPTVTWLGVIEDTIDVLEGIEAEDQVEIMTALREMIHYDPWVLYNPGDPAYTDFEGMYVAWSYIWIEMSDWLDRTQGYALYCHSLACLLSSLANHLGLDVQYLTLGLYFQTHLTRAAGTDYWRTWRFNSHGITTLGETNLVWDAAVDFDGDSDPDREPTSPISPTGVTLEEYFNMLTADEIEVILSGYCYVF